MFTKMPRRGHEILCIWSSKVFSWSNACVGLLGMDFSSYPGIASTGPESLLLPLYFLIAYQENK